MREDPKTKECSTGVDLNIRDAIRRIEKRVVKELESVLNDVQGDIVDLTDRAYKEGYWAGKADAKKEK